MDARSTVTRSAALQVPLPMPHAVVIGVAARVTFPPRRRPLAGVPRARIRQDCAWNLYPTLLLSKGMRTKELGPFFSSPS